MVQTPREFVGLDAWRAVLQGLRTGTGTVPDCWCLIGVSPEDATVGNTRWPNHSAMWGRDAGTRSARKPPCPPLRAQARPFWAPSISAVPADAGSTSSPLCTNERDRAAAERRPSVSRRAGHPGSGESLRRSPRRAGSGRRCRPGRTGWTGRPGIRNCRGSPCSRPPHGSLSVRFCSGWVYSPDFGSRNRVITDAGHAVPCHPPVPAGVVLAQGSLHARGQHSLRQVSPVLAGLDEGQPGEVGVRTAGLRSD